MMMPGRPRVLVFCDYFVPGFKGGGPVTTLRNLLVRLGERIDFHLVTRDRDLGDTTPYANVITNSWTPVPGGKVLYLNEGGATIGAFRSLIAEIQPDTIYLNSALSRRFSLLPLLAVRTSKTKAHVVLAPRGEFSAGALALKRVQKTLYLAALRASGAWRDIEWQASSAFEAADIRAVAGTAARISIAPDLPGAIPALPQHLAKQAGRAKIVFLGRISPMKNLDGAIGMLRGVTGELDFGVYGPIEDLAYWERCLKLAQDLPPNVRFHHEGEVPPQAVHPLLAAADALLLPSHGENFGHVVAEALGAGCPVILSDRTPWRNLQALGAGWDLSLDQLSGFTAAIQQIIDMGDNQHAGYRNQARAYAERLADDADILESNLAQFQR